MKHLKKKGKPQLGNLKWKTLTKDEMKREVRRYVNFRLTVEDPIREFHVAHEE